GKRFGLSEAQKGDMWRRWKAGQSLHEIGRAFGKEHSSIRCLVHPTARVHDLPVSAAISRGPFATFVHGRECSIFAFVSPSCDSEPNGIISHQM
ncbi:MAG: hypothetical protein WBC04_20485, partial [Candidatus Acidiferrales bacterium]